jgi:hypothetical protein
MKTIIVTKTPDGSYMFVETGQQEAGFADTSSVPSVTDMQRKLAARGVTPKAITTILEELATKGEVVYPLG